MQEMQENQERSGPSVVTAVEETNWQSPEYEVVETALEVTAYALAAR